jgi:hypothetical protein
MGCRVNIAISFLCCDVADAGRKREVFVVAMRLVVGFWLLVVGFWLLVFGF